VAALEAKRREVALAASMARELAAQREQAERAVAVQRQIVADLQASTEAAAAAAAGGARPPTFT
jgi:hypothetical protein